MAVICGPHLSAQDHLSTDAAHAAVRSPSYSGTILVGAALVARIDAPTIHGWWGLRVPQAVVSSVHEASTPGLMPTDGMVAVSASEEARVNVRDITGKQINVPTTRTGATVTINLSGVISGVYFVLVTSGDRVDRYRVLSTE